MNIFIATFAALLVASMIVGGTGASYKELNNYLIEKVNNDEVAANMAAANKWLEEQQNVKQSFLSKSPVGDLKKFTALQQVIDDTKCDRSAYDIMRPNEEAVGLRKLLEDGQVIRRVDKVIYSIFEEHAKKCALVYPVVYRQKRQLLEQSKCAQVERLGQTIMGWDKYFASVRYHAYFFEPRGLLDRYIKITRTVRDFANKGVFYEVLLHNAKDDPNFKYTQRIPDEHSGKAVVHKDQLKELARKHLIEPCQFYVDELGPDVFTPARFELSIYSRPDSRDRDFYLSWSYYQLCRRVVKDERAVYDYVIASATKAKV